MSFEAITTISDAENRARQIKADAQAAAAAAVEAAQAEGKAAIEAAPKEFTAPWINSFPSGCTIC